jgi:hypothetical protein
LTCCAVAGWALAFDGDVVVAAPVQHGVGVQAEFEGNVARGAVAVVVVLGEPGFGDAGGWCVGVAQWDVVGVGEAHEIAAVDAVVLGEHGEGPPVLHVVALELLFGELLPQDGQGLSMAAILGAVVAGGRCRGQQVPDGVVRGAQTHRDPAHGVAVQDHAVSRGEIELVGGRVRGV